MQWSKQEGDNWVFTEMGYVMWQNFRDKIIKVDMESDSPILKLVAEGGNEIIRCTEEAPDYIWAQYTPNTDEFTINKYVVLHVIFGDEWTLGQYMNDELYAMKIITEITLALINAPADIKLEFRKRLKERRGE
ncbi:MAG: hypothetical protein HF312_17145 [Ignavibacteria bacterium]|jgi:hypothetical protein|nr:hypothetical protein [Ignavibacteria bacterium]